MFSKKNPADPPSQFKCEDRGWCLPLTWRCDAEDDCLDASDEDWQLCRGRFGKFSSCPPDTFRCSTVNRCIPERWKCDHERDCPDGSDESACEGRNQWGKRLEQAQNKGLMLHLFIDNLPLDRSQVNTRARPSSRVRGRVRLWTVPPA